LQIAHPKPWYGYNLSPQNAATRGAWRIHFAYRTNMVTVFETRLHLRIRKDASYVPSLLRCRLRQANPTETVHPSIQENSQSRNSSISGATHVERPCKPHEANPTISKGKPVPKARERAGRKPARRNSGYAPRWQWNRAALRAAARQHLFERH
jgi:hypothetical protein